MSDGQCPRCYYVATITAFIPDKRYGDDCMNIVARLPREVSETVLDYLTLFRRKNTKIDSAWKVSFDILKDIESLIMSGYVQWKSKPARKASPKMWAEGMRRMMKQAAAGALTLPMESNGYLRTIVYDLADTADAKNETSQNQAERSGTYRQEVKKQETQEARPDPEFMRKIREMKLPKKPGMAAMSDLIPDMVTALATSADSQPVKQGDPVKEYVEGLLAEGKSLAEIRYKALPRQYVERFQELYGFVGGDLI